MTPKRKKQREKLVTIIILIAVALSSSIIGCAANYDVEVSTVTVTHKPKEIIKEEKVETVEEQIKRLASEHNFKWPDYLIRLAKCENTKLNPQETNDYGNSPSHSTDRGIFQINDYWHSEVSDECAFDVECSTVWTMDRINKGYQHEWVCDKLI